nr:MAG TPA: hypothetical protein [Caudoviricetes sp.]
MGATDTNLLIINNKYFSPLFALNFTKWIRISL